MSFTFGNGGGRQNSRWTPSTVWTWKYFPSLIDLKRRVRMTNLVSNVRHGNLGIGAVMFAPTTPPTPRRIPDFCPLPVLNPNLKPMFLSANT